MVDLADSSLNDSTASMRTISEGSLFHTQLSLGRTTAGSKLHGCRSVYRREGAYDG